MSKVFADTLYWIAISRPNDQWSQPSKAAREKLGDVVLVTTDEVLIEFLSSLAKGSSQVRAVAVSMVRAILDDPNVQVIPQTRDGFLAGITVFENRLDKGYSLTDSISMTVMKTEKIDKVLTNDSHFSQEGFQILIQ